MSRLLSTRSLWIVMTLAACWAGWQHWQQRAVVHGPGVLVREEPYQAEIDGKPPVFRKDDYVMTALARYRIRGRLLHRQAYRSDASSGISPLDFGLGWGPMSDSSILGQMEFSQSARFLNWSWDTPEPPIPFKVINSHASNTHLIPGDGQVFDALNTMREGQVVELSGYLVSVKGPNGFNWSGSLTRTDQGQGACEVMYVESARIIKGNT